MSVGKRDSQHSALQRDNLGRMAEVFDMEGLIRAASPYQIHPVIVTTIDAMQVVAGNFAVERYVGFRVSELVGGTASRLFGSSIEFRNAAACIRSAFSHGQNGYYGYFHMRRGDGSRFNARLVVSLVRELRSDRVLAVIVIRDPTIQERPDDTYSQYGLDLDAISSNIPGGLFQRVLSPNGDVRYPFLRGQVLERLCIDPEAVEQDSELLLRQMNEEDRWVFNQRLEESARYLSPVDLVLRYKTPGGDEIRVRTLSQPRRLDDDVILWDGIMLEVGEEHEAAIRHQQLAYSDALTGLPNLAGFKILLDSLLPRREDEQIIVGVVNVKRMAVVNQVLGASKGNEIIRQIAHRLVQFTGKMDRVARTPNGDFLFYLTATPRDSLEEAGGRLVDQFSEPVTLSDEGGSGTSVDASIGLVLFPQHGTTADEALLNADTALNRARRTSKSSYCVYSQALRDELREEAQLEQELREAIEARTIVPHYQPQFDLITGKVVGLEALARWTRADGARVPPQRFVSIAEKAGLVSALGKVVVSHVIGHVKAWQLAAPVPPVFINISGLHLCDGDFDTWFLGELAKHEIDVAAIGIEVTESTFLLNLDEATECMNRLTRAGVRFSMDDFGTGYSSLSYLANLPFHSIKIDRAFVDELESNARKSALVDSIIKIGQGLELDVVAEGVESAAQVVLLRTLGCRTGQGYYFCKPVPASEIPAWLEHSPRPGDISS